MKTKQPFSSFLKATPASLPVYAVIGAVVIVMIYIYFSDPCISLVGSTFRSKSHFDFEGEMYQRLNFGIGAFHTSLLVGGMISFSDSGTYECALGKISALDSHGNTITGQYDSFTGTLILGGAYKRTSGPETLIALVIGMVIIVLLIARVLPDGEHKP